MKISALDDQVSQLAYRLGSSWRFQGHCTLIRATEFVMEGLSPGEAVVAAAGEDGLSPATARKRLSRLIEQMEKAQTEEYIAFRGDVKKLSPNQLLERLAALFKEKTENQKNA